MIRLRLLNTEPQLKTLRLNEAVNIIPSLANPNLGSQGEYTALINALSDVYALSDTINNHTNTKVTDTAAGVHGLRYFDGDLQYYDADTQSWKIALRKDEIAMMSKNYDTNATDLTIPGCVEYVKDSLYSLSKNYVSVYPNLIYNSTTQKYSTTASFVSQQSESNIPYQLSVFEGTENQNATLKHVTFEEGVKQIGYKSFRGQNILDRIDFPESLEWVHPDAFYETAWYDRQPLGEVYCGNVLYTYKLDRSKTGNLYTLDRHINVKPGTKSISSYAFREAYYYSTQPISGIRTITLPDGLIGIGDYAFKFVSLLNVDINLPESVTWIGKGAFLNSSATICNLPQNIEVFQSECFELCKFANNSVSIPRKVKSIEYCAFNKCMLSTITFDAQSELENIGAFSFTENAISSVSLPNNLKVLGMEAFAGNPLTYISLPASLTSIGEDVFKGCTSVTNVEVEEGFKATNLDLSFSPLITAESLRGVINNLADRTGLCPAVLTLGAANLAKLTNSEIAVATDKNWTVA